MTPNDKIVPRRPIIRPNIEEPTWADWSGIQNAELWEVVALSCNLNPRCLLKWIKPRPITNVTLTAFHDRLRLAVASLEIYEGSLACLEPSAQAEYSRVRFGDFRAWAVEKGLALPDQFPNHPAKSPQRESPQQRKFRLKELYDAELRKGKSKTEALKIVAMTEPSQRPQFEGQKMSPETLRKILARE